MDAYKDYLIYGWPIFFLFILALVAGIEGYRYLQEKAQIKKHPSFEPVALPDQLVLIRSTYHKEKDQSWLNAFLFLFIVVSLLMLLILRVADGSDIQFNLTFLSHLWQKIVERPAVWINLLFTMLVMFLVIVWVVYLGKKERFTLTRDSIAYTSPLEMLMPSWEVRWEDVKEMKLGNFIRVGGLQITTLDGKKKNILPHIWLEKNTDIHPQYKSRLSRMLFLNKLQGDVELACRFLPLLRYIQQKTNRTIHIKQSGSLEFDLFSHPATKWSMLMIFALFFYGLLDTIGNTETYAGRWPLAMMIIPVLLVMSIATGLLWSKPIPHSNTIVLALMLGGMTGFAMYPGLLRINQLTADQPQQEFKYRYVGDYQFRPVQVELPDLLMKPAEYFDSFKNGTEMTFVLRKGALGFYQLDMEPVYASMRVWHCQQSAGDDKKKQRDCQNMNQ